MPIQSGVYHHLHHGKKGYEMASVKLLLATIVGVCVLSVFTISSAPGTESDSNSQTSVVDQDQSDSSLDYRYTTGDRYLTIGRPRVVFSEDRSQLTCSVSWDKSWRNGDAFDAAWLFAKARDESGRWSHVKIIHARQQPQSDGIRAEVRPSPDGMGVLVSRAEDGQGDNRWIIDFAISPEVPRETIQDIKVFGLEMVHIPQGAYDLGTLKSLSDRDEVLTPGAGGAPYNSFHAYSASGKDNYGGIFKVESENPIDIGPEEGNLFWVDAEIRGANTFSGIPEGRLGERFPKGYNGFLLM
ncbi:MAG: hypothetical protein AAFY91_18770, partial [Bacteroidota bacterium]